MATTRISSRDTVFRRVPITTAQTVMLYGRIPELLKFT